MESELIKLHEANNIEKLQAYVEKLDINDVCAQLSRICAKENGSVILLSLLNGLSTSSSCQEKRMKISKAVLETIENKLVSSKLTEKLVSILATQMESFSTDNVITLIDTCLKMMKESKEPDGCNCWKELIPKLLNKIAEEDVIEHNGLRIKGTQYKSEVVVSICMSDWSDTIVTNIASMFVDMILSPEEHLKVVNKLCKKMKSMKLQEIPPLVHQMLQLTKEQHFMQLFIALAEIFDERLYSLLIDQSNASTMKNTGGTLKEIQTVEGTVLYHLYSIISSLGPQSVKDFLKTLKECVNSPSFILSPFTITFLLTISCVSYIFEEEVLNITKAAILRNFLEQEKISDSAWLETFVPKGIQINDLFEKIILNCFRERDKVLKGLVNLAFSLLGTQKTRGKESQCDEIWRLGSSLLTRLINKCADITNSVLKTLTNQISQVHESTQYTDCLFHIIRKSPLNVLDCSSILIQLLDNVCTRLPGNVAKRVVTVMLPLTQMSQSLRDNLIIVLRKSLFLHDKTCREMAVTGILELLKGLKISNLRNLSQSTSQSYCGLTQIYSETHVGPGPSNSNEGLCLELLSILREVFKHQQEVKTIFYRGIYESVYVNPELGCHALDNLQNQFSKYYKPGNDIPPLHFDQTVALQGNNAVLLEPLSHLILSIGLIVTKIEEVHTKCSTLRMVFDSLAERMSSSDIPHFFLGKEIFDGSPESLMKEEEVIQILGAYEALMGYMLCTWTKESTTHGEMLNSLFRGYCRLSDYVRNIGKPDKKKAEDKGKNKTDEMPDKRREKGKSVPFRFPQTILNLKCACRMLSIFYEDSVPWVTEESIAMIKNRRELHRYGLNVTLTLLKQIQLTPGIELSKDRAALGYITKIGRIIFTRCVRRVIEMKAFDSQSGALSIECFSELIQLVLLHFKGRLHNFINDIGVYTAESGVNNQLKVMIIDILNQMSTLCTEKETKEEEALNRKSLQLLVTIATSLFSQLPRGAEALQIMDKMKSICKEVKVESPIAAKSILGLLLLMHTKCKASGSLLTDLVFCLCENMELISDATNIEEHAVYAIINQKTANACIVAVCDTLRFHVNLVEWVIGRLKAELLILTLPSNEIPSVKLEDIYEKERALCLHINFCTRVLGLLCAIAVPPGIYADAVLKEIGNFYNKLVIVTKYFILKIGKYHQQLQNSKFDKTVKLIDHELSRNMYRFTEHVIADGTGGFDDKTLKKDPAFLKNKCLRETKIIPKVIYEKEQFQKFILQLSNKSKIDLVGQTKHALARDYRLLAKQVKEILEKENVQYEEMDAEEVEEEENEEDEDRSSKKAKLAD